MHIRKALLYVAIVFQPSCFLCVSHELATIPMILSPPIHVHYNWKNWNAVNVHIWTQYMWIIIFNIRFAHFIYRSHYLYLTAIRWLFSVWLLSFACFPLVIFCGLKTKHIRLVNSNDIANNSNNNNCTTTHHHHHITGHRCMWYARQALSKACNVVVTMVELSSNWLVRFHVCASVCIQAVCTCANNRMNLVKIFFKHWKQLAAQK